MTVKAENKKGELVEFKGDYCLVSVGRSPYTSGLNAESAGVKLTDRGQVEVNSIYKRRHLIFMPLAMLSKGQC